MQSSLWKMSIVKEELKGFKFGLIKFMIDFIYYKSNNNHSDN